VFRIPRRRDEDGIDAARDERCVMATPGSLVPQWLTQDNIVRIESSSSHIYWVTDRNGKAYLRRVPFGGGPVEQIHEGAGRVLAVTDNVVYEVVDNHLLKVDIAASCPVDIADLGPGSWLQIVIDADNVYVADWEKRVIRVAKATGALTELTPATSLLGYLKVSGGYLYFVRTNDIARYPVIGGNVETVVTTGGNVERMLVDSDHVFWVAPAGDAQGDTALYRAPVTGGPRSTLWTASEHTWSAGADAAFIYVGQSGPCGCGVCDDLIVRVPKAGGTPTVLVGGQNYIGWEDKALAVGNGAIAWFTSQSYAQLWSARLP
jgi:hypothetical protein